METLEEENFGVSISSPSDAEFDAIVGYLEDIVMDNDFQLIQRNFMDKYYREFDDTEENKLVYTPIFNEYICLVEKYIEAKLLDRIPGFNMSSFTLSLQSLMKMLKSTGPRTEPSGTPLPTFFHVDLEPLRTTHWVRLGSQLFFHLHVLKSTTFLPNLWIRRL